MGFGSDDSAGCVESGFSSEAARSEDSFATFMEADRDR
jgi:hypothetical protein